MIPTPEDLVRYVRAHPGRKTGALAEALGVGEEEYDRLLDLLQELMFRGEVLRVPREGWTVPGKTGFRVGAIRLSRRGGAFVTLKKPEPAGDIRVPAGAARDAFDGDLVLVRLEEERRRPKGRRGRRERRTRRGERAEHLAGNRPRLREGQVVEVLRRHPQPIHGRFWVAEGQGGRGPGAPARAGFVRPLARQLAPEIYVAPEDSAGARDGEKVLVRLLPGESYGIYPRGRVEVRITDEGSLESDFQVIAAEFAFPIEHPPEALAEAGGLPALTPQRVQEELKRGRHDLRGLRAITIDPADARDFDDAVSLEELPEGGLRLGVHIADVSSYAPSGSALDRSAEIRGTSIYLPGRVVPMLPERLSNDLASLRPGEDRLTKTVFLDFDAAGEPAGSKILRSVIRNQRRFTYQEVLRLLDAGDRERGEPPFPRASYPRDRREQAEDEAPLPADADEYSALLLRMADLRDRLWARRHARGALDLDLPRLRLRTADAGARRSGPDGGGEVLSIERDERDPAHHLIEEFMLAANEAVAAYFEANGLPLISRIHPPPDEDRLADFFDFLDRLGYGRRRRSGGSSGIPGAAASRELQGVVEATAGDASSGIIQLALLQSLAHAEYAPAAGLHFALATSVYCHFTSPIRRYPDLLVHQVLDEHWDGKLRSAGRRLEWEEALPGQAASSSQTERRAEEAEREMTKLRLIRFLQPRVGEEMVALVVSVHPFGFFVRSEEWLIEGLVHISSLNDDYYVYDEDQASLKGQRRRRVFRVGDRLRVQLAEVNPDLREINFRYLGRVKGG